MLVLMEYRVYEFRCFWGGRGIIFNVPLYRLLQM